MTALSNETSTRVSHHLILVETSWSSVDKRECGTCQCQAQGEVKTKAVFHLERDRQYRHGVCRYLRRSSTLSTLARPPTSTTTASPARSATQRCSTLSISSLQYTMRRLPPVRETITYPKVAITSEYDPCHDITAPFEHVLACGHLVTTFEPEEPCAPNCYHANNDGSRRASTMNLSKSLRKEFYCDACVEVDAEREIDESVSCKAAGELRFVWRPLQI